MARESPAQFDPKVDYYSVLHVPPTASSSDIKRSYRDLLLRLHPDRNESESAADECTGIVNAYRVLIDEDLRKRWEAERKAAKEEESNVWKTLRWTDLCIGHGGVRSAECRCGGQFALEEDELKDLGAEEEAILVDCDTCSLSIEVRTK